MKRRTFFTIAAFGSGIMALGLARFQNLSFEDAAEGLIIKELNFLKLEPSGVRNFVRDYGKSKNRRYKFTVKGYSLVGITSSQSGKIHQLVTNYLLSTDFFSNNMDQSRVIHYVRLYDPYLRPCTHPFAHRRQQVV